MSADSRVDARQWRIAVFALALTLIGGAALAVALLIGAADPPRAAILVLNLNSADSLTPAGSSGDVRLLALPADLTPPFTIEMEASNSGAGGSAWGVWLRDGATVYPMLIDTQGYVLSATETTPLQHQQFPFIQPNDNRLYVNFDGGSAVFRINEEVFTTLPLDAIQAGGLALYGAPNLDWKSIKVYTG